MASGELPFVVILGEDGTGKSTIAWDALLSQAEYPDVHCVLALSEGGVERARLSVPMRGWVSLKCLAVIAPPAKLQSAAGEAAASVFVLTPFLVLAGVHIAPQFLGPGLY